MTYGTVVADQIQNTTGYSLGAGNASIMKNRVINGEFKISQYNGSSSVNNVAAANTYAIDRFAYYSTVATQFAIQQNAGSVTPPTGFVNYLGITNGASAYTPVAASLIVLDHQIEAYNVSDLGYGTANAKTCTLSFYVYSSLTGTFGGTIQNGAQSRAYGFTYTVSVANTWTFISVTIPGDTSGSWATNNNTRGISINWNLGCGSTFNTTAGTWQTGQYFGVTGTVNLVSTANATFYITGVQFEVGSIATGFEYRNYQQELALCMRYYQTLPYQTLTAGAYSTNSVSFRAYPFIVMRAAPTATYTGTTVEWVGVSTPTISSTSNSSFANKIQVDFSFTPAITPYVPMGSPAIQLSAEL